MSICVLHERLGPALGELLRRALPDADIVVTDVEPPPAVLERVEILIAGGVPEGMLRRTPRLEWLQLTATGVEHVRREIAGTGILLSHAGAVPARAVAEFAWMAILSLAKDLPGLVEGQRARTWRLPDARLLAGSTLGLVGLGRIGSEIARRAAGFDMRVVAIRRSGRHSPLADEVVSPDRALEVAPRVDHLVIAAPGGEGTRGLVGPAFLAALPESAVVINVGRASIVDTPALVAALRAGRLRGALVDVHDQEPLPADSPLWDVERLVVTPHGAFSFPQEAELLADLFLHNLSRYERGLPLENAVDMGR